MTETLGERLPKEMTRVRNLIALYESFPTGIFAAKMMRDDIARAEKAMSEEDIGEMVRVCKSLMEWKL